MIGPYGGTSENEVLMILKTILNVALEFQRLCSNIIKYSSHDLLHFIKSLLIQGSSTLHSRC